LSEEAFEEMKRLALRLNRLITEAYAPLGVKNVDGKFEFAVDERGEVTVVDVFGTPDECRLLLNGLDLSKQLLRDFYLSTEWGKRVMEAKATERSERWREMAGEPPPLPPHFQKAVSEVYLSLANHITGKDLFSVPPLNEAVERASALLKRLRGE
jgi:phosphoribosylaminoimidazole-succinocarboxamide synthase